MGPEPGGARPTRSSRASASWVPLGGGAGLWLSGERWVTEAGALAELAPAVKCILSFARPEDPPFETPPGVWRHLQVQANEDDTDTIRAHLDAIVAFIESHASHGLLVHCMGGICRAPTAVIAYLAWQWGVAAATPGSAKLLVQGAKASVKSVRAQINPRFVLLQAVEDWLSRRLNRDGGGGSGGGGESGVGESWGEKEDREEGEDAGGYPLPVSGCSCDLWVGGGGGGPAAAQGRVR